MLLWNTTFKTRGTGSRLSRLVPLLLLSIAFYVAALASPLGAQTGRSAQTRNATQNFPEIGDVTILVYDVDRNSETIAELKPGETATIPPGRRMRLRMQIKPHRNAKRARFPTARYEPIRPLTVIRPVKLDERYGSYTFFGERQSARRGAQAIDYAITDNSYVIPRHLRTGRVFIELADVPRPENLPGRPPANLPVRPPENLPEPVRLGVTLYEHVGFRGRSERLYSDDPNLRDNIIGNDRLSSIRVDRGCVVRLFEASDYRGTSNEIDYDLGDFNSLRVRNDHVSSIQVDCNGDRTEPEYGRPGFRQGVTLYSSSNFRGDTTFFVDGSYGDLRRTEIGERRASSVEVSRGCLALLYELPDFRGRSIEVRDDLSRLDRTELGDDAVGSIRVLCR